MIILNAIKNALFAIGEAVARLASWLYARPYILVAGLLVALILTATMYQKRGQQIDSLTTRSDTLQRLTDKLQSTITTATAKIEINHETETKASLTDSLVASAVDSAVLVSKIDSILSINRARRNQATQ